MTSYCIAFVFACCMSVGYLWPAAAAFGQTVEAIQTEQQRREEELRSQEAYFAQRARQKAQREALMMYGGIAAVAVVGLVAFSRIRSKRRGQQPKIGTSAPTVSSSPAFAPNPVSAHPPSPALPPPPLSAIPVTSMRSPVEVRASGPVAASGRPPAGHQTVSALLEEGKAFYQQRQYAEAQRAFEAASTTPPNSEAHYYLGLIALGRNDRAEAARHLRTAIADFPGHFDAHFYLGETLAGRGDSQSAAVHYSAVLRIKPDHGPAQQRLRALGVDLSSLNQTPVYPAQPAIQPSTTPAIGPLPDEGDDEPYLGDVYDSLRASKDEFSRMAVKMIAETRIKPRHPIMRAYLGEFLGMLAMVFTIAIVAVVVESIGDSLRRNATSTYFQSKGSPDSPGGVAKGTELQVLNAALAGALRVARLVEIAGSLLLLLFFVRLVYFLYYCQRRAQTVMSIGRGLISLESGIFTTQRKNHEIYRISEFIAHQDFFNRMTGDGSLRIVYTSPHETVDLKGLASYAELQVLAAKLRSLHLQLRSTNIGKGIMQ